MHTLTAGAWWQKNCDKILANFLAQRLQKRDQATVYQKAPLAKGCRWCTTHYKMMRSLMLSLLVTDLNLVLRNKLRNTPTSNFRPIRLLDPDCCYKFTYLMANSADPDQLASSEANWSGSTLFAKSGYIWFSRTRVNIDMKHLYPSSTLSL